MNNNKSEFTVKSHFEDKSPIVRKIYDQLLKSLKPVGPIIEEPKKTSIHLVNATAFAGIATRKDYLILTIKSDRELISPRIYKGERVSAKRFHSEVKLASPGDVDKELLTWLKDAYRISG